MQVVGTPSRFVRMLCLASLLAATVERVRADELDLTPRAPAEDPGLSPTVFWIAASATIITASLGGFYALHVRDLYDEAQLQPLISPERTRIRGEMETAEVTADVLLLGSLAMAVGTTILTFYIDWSGAERSARLAAAKADAGEPLRRTWW